MRSIVSAVRAIAALFDHAVPPGRRPAASAGAGAFASVWSIKELLAVAFLDRSYYEVAEATLEVWQPEAEPEPLGL